MEYYLLFSTTCRRRIRQLWSTNVLLLVEVKHSLKKSMIYQRVGRNIYVILLSPSREYMYGVLPLIISSTVLSVKGSVYSRCEQSCTPVME